MTTKSYPAVGTGGLSADEWSTTYGSEDAIVGDYSGDTFPLLRNDSSDSITIPATGHIKVNGYTLDLDQDESFSVPPVTGSPVTYYVGAQYDPALNVEESDGTASTLGPCRLGVWTALDTANHKSYCPLYTIVRSQSQLLSQAVVSDYRRWSGPVVVVNADDARNYPLNFGAMPRGSVIIQTGDPLAVGASVWIREINAAKTGLVWTSLQQSERIALPILGDKVAQNTAPTYFHHAGNMISFDGTVTRANGQPLISPENAYVTLASMPDNATPNSLRRFECSAGFKSMSQLDSVTVTVDTASQVRILPPPSYKGAVGWVDLSGITYRAGR